MYVVICVVSLCYGEGDGFLTVFLVVKVKVVLFPSMITISKSTEGRCMQCTVTQKPLVKLGTASLFVSHHSTIRQFRVLYVRYKRNTRQYKRGSVIILEAPEGCNILLKDIHGQPRFPKFRT